MKKVRVVIVEDSKLMQRIITDILSSDPDITVIGAVSDPLLARDLIKKTNPDVLTLDVMLPHMDGITFLKNLMRLHPMPVVMVSALTEAGSNIGLEALSIGAVDFIAKPTEREIDNLSHYSKELITAVKNAAQANVLPHVVPFATEKTLEKSYHQADLLKNEVIAIGASTGGIEAIEKILIQLPTVLPPIVIVQHIKKEFSAAFPNRIKKLYGLSAEVAENYSALLPGHIYVAPGNGHLTVKKHNNRFFCRILDTDPINNHKPAIDVLFHSVAEQVGKNAIGILLTGMGKDGAEGLKAIHDAGGATVVQDEETSVVWGMPAAAIKINAVDFITPLDMIPIKILQIIDERALNPNF